MENKEKTLEDVKAYLNDKVSSGLKAAEVFEKRLISDRQGIVESQKKVQEAKANDPKTPYSDHKGEITNIHQKFYYSSFIEEQLKILLGKVKEFSIMADILGIELDLEGDHAEVIKFIRKIDNEYFVVDSKGEIIMPDAETKRMLEEGINAQISNEEFLKEMFNRIPAK